ncbi:hypothetical protein P4S91_26720 [Aneurinibacillus aneurinilyticus]|uniref:hypothetical protein n=1 Tax=Aneurinibacillus aneurinilyticus TaxID=1391 RepID=UPI002E1D132A|nr:hypothetical protein [Aneurinibacillus aneurinilyticus]MED0726434.1 hypothetical protein [Aneurinibacillus aneurinilyticus]
MREGDYGQAHWICTNEICEKFNPDWPGERLRKKLLPVNEEIEKLSKFEGGIIEIFDARWVGEGSADIKFDDGEEFTCHLIKGVFYPIDELRITDDIKERFLKLIDCRKKIAQIIREK